MTEPTTHETADAGPRVIVGMLAFRSPDPQRLARFWAELVGLPVADGASDQLVMLDFDHEVGPQTWMFEPAAAGEPSGSRLGLDIALQQEDWRALADRAVELGAERVSDNAEGGVEWVELRDPDGNRFRVFPPRRPE